MVIINNSLCEESYLLKLDKFINNNLSNFINEENENYFYVFDNNKNINNSFISYTEIENHLKFLQAKFPTFLNKINTTNYDIKCVINRLTIGSYIKPHVDASIYTHILYLNSNFEGGDTIFLSDKKSTQEKKKEILKISPERNLSLFTSENYFHKVNPIISGERFTLTTFIRNKKNYESTNVKNII